MSDFYGIKFSVRVCPVWVKYIVVLFMNTRDRPKLDYKIFHEAGKKVFIEGEEIKFEMANTEEIAELKYKSYFENVCA